MYWFELALWKTLVNLLKCTSNSSRDSTISALPCQINQTLDSSRPNNCIMSVDRLQSPCEGLGHFMKNGCIFGNRILKI